MSIHGSPERVNVGRDKCGRALPALDRVSPDDERVIKLVVGLVGFFGRAITLNNELAALMEAGVISDDDGVQHFCALYNFIEAVKDVPLPPIPSTGERVASVEVVN